MNYHCLEFCGCGHIYKENEEEENKKPTVEQCVDLVALALKNGISHDGAVLLLEQLLELTK